MAVLGRVESRRVKRTLEVVSFDTDEVVRRLDVTNKTESQVEKIERGLMRNMDLDKYFVRDSADNG